MSERPRISAMCLVKNEERWIWYALMSALDFVDEIIVGDTGSTDRTVEIIRSINSPKIHFSEYGSVDKQEFTNCRNRQLEQATGDWLLVLDGDELWTPRQISELLPKLTQAKPEQITVAVRFFNCVGDIYHYQDDHFSSYRKWDIEGNITCRLMRRSIPGLTCNGPYGVEGFYDETGREIFEESTKDQVILLKERYVHATFLVRSNSVLGDWQIPYRRGKFLNVLGVRDMPKDFDYPSSFSKKPPSGVNTPWRQRPVVFFWFFGFLSSLAYRAWKIKSRINAR